MRSMSGYGTVALSDGRGARPLRGARRSRQRPDGSLAASIFTRVWPDGRESPRPDGKDGPR